MFNKKALSDCCIKDLSCCIIKLYTLLLPTLQPLPPLPSSLWENEQLNTTRGKLINTDLIVTYEIANQCPTTL